MPGRAADPSATLRHELRAPMRVATGLAEELRAEHAGELTADARVLIDQLVSVLGRAEALVEALGGLDAGRPPPPGTQTCDVGDALAVALEDLGPELSAHGAEVLAGPLPRVAADPALVTQVLRNLVENAVRYNPAEDPRVTVTAELANGVAEIVVADNGPGIPPEEAERIFERGTRGGRFERCAGSGLGLDVCRRIVATWGGEIRAEADGGPGAVFRFSVPVRAPRARRSAG